MSQTKALLPHLRKQKIKQMIANNTQEEIAKACFCERHTIIRDIIEMKESGEWWQWIEYELHRLHKEGNVSDESKYREMSKLYSKQFIVSKEESTTEHKGEITIKAWKLGDADKPRNHS